MKAFKVASFDLDGTLVRGSTGAFLAGKLGHRREMEAIEAMYASGNATNTEVAELDARYYKGLVSRDLADMLLDIPVVDGIGETVAILKKRGMVPVISTIAWDVVAEVFAERYGFAAWSGPSLVKGTLGRFTGAVAKHFEATDKVTFLRRICHKASCSLKEAFHVGDSRSDFPLFESVGFSVAFNAGPEARSHASVAFDSESLLGVLPLVLEPMKKGSE